MRVTIMRIGLAILVSLFLIPSSLVYAGKIYRLYLHSRTNKEGVVSHEVALGEVVEETNEYIKINLADGIKTYSRKEIERVEEVPGFTQDEQKTFNKGMEVLNNNLKTTFESAERNCADFMEKLKKCEPYECSYVYFGGMTGKKKIVGFENNKCHSEDIVGSHKLDCRYSQATLDAENPLQAAVDKGECIDTKISE